MDFEELLEEEFEESVDFEEELFEDAVLAVLRVLCVDLLEVEKRSRVLREDLLEVDCCT